MRVVLTIIGIIVLVIALALWSTIKAEIVSNGKKTVITLSMYRFLKYEFAFPIKKKTAENGSSDESRDSVCDNCDDIGDIEDKNTEEVKDEAKDEGTLAGVRRDIRSMWNSDTHFLDFERIRYVIEKYTRIAKSAKSAVGQCLRCLKRKIRIGRFDVYMRYGLDEPEKTGTAYGTMYALSGYINSVMKRSFKVESGLELYLAPDYVNRCFEFETGIIIKTRAAYILYALVAALIVYILNNHKGSVKNVRNFRQASD